MDRRGKKRRSFRNLCGIQKGRFKGWDLVGLAKILASGYRISAVGRIEQTLSTSLLWMGEKKNGWARKEAEVIPQPMRNPERIGQ